MKWKVCICNWDLLENEPKNYVVIQRHLENIIIVRKMK